MNANDSVDALLRQLRRLEHQNSHLQYQVTLLEEAIETICYAFLNNPHDIETAIQTAISLKEQAIKPPDSPIKPSW
jgi:hypothetical protein